MLSTSAVMLVAAFGSGAVRSVAKLPWHEAFSFGHAGCGSALAAKRDAMTGTSATALSRAVPRPFLAAAVLVLAGAAVDAAIPAPELTYPPRASFDEFPNRVGDWVGKRDTLQGIYLNALRLDDYVLADYHEDRMAYR